MDLKDFSFVEWQSETAPTQRVTYQQTRNGIVRIAGQFTGLNGDMVYSFASNREDGIAHAYQLYTSSRVVTALRATIEQDGTDLLVGISTQAERLSRIFRLPCITQVLTEAQAKDETPLSVEMDAIMAKAWKALPSSERVAFHRVAGWSNRPLVEVITFALSEQARKINGRVAALADQFVRSEF